MNNNNIDKKLKEWEDTTLSKVLEKHPERKKQFRTTSGTIFKRLYTPLDTNQENYLDNLGIPGKFPFTRGVQPTMYRGRFWTMRQYAGFATAKDSNERYKYLLNQGQTGLSVAFDLPTQIGYDSDDPISMGEVGKVGVAIDSLADMEILFDGIPLDRVSTSMTINASASVLFAMYLVVAEKQGVSLDRVSGTIQNDILKEYIARGTYIFPPKFSMRLITDIFEFCSQHVPKWNTISISGYHIREAGSTAVQEVAFTLANAIEYVKAAVEKGLDVDNFAQRLSFFFNAHNNLLEEVAKFRAARRLWSKIMKNRFNARDPKSMMLRFHTQTAGSTLTSQQPDNNIIRVTLQALAAVLGGTQSLHTNSRDEALALPTEESVRIALRTQQIIAHESGVADTIDPLAGSYLIESLTDSIEAQAEEYISKIDSLGGVLPAIESGYIQKCIQDSSYDAQKAIETEDQIVVGMNKFTVEEPAPTGLLRINPAVEKAQVSSLSALKGNRNQEAVSTALANLKTASQGDSNLMYPIMEAVRAYASLGEICNVLREVHGEYKENVVL
ncbi:MAG: methylmalonyl-CoA mutase [Candidatus Wallbacteria bacterium HGW-Wallbacteria-1]|uniref:Methylmalonyl-CoA mutase n=1 Tax=Candidatus Wallbacteria bacterium HGW-Wallbacteria-1 TaxID=2013854 RepID=A0A2N1PTF2_9BACT|nr:MAG: methylmalonyl-CoA mutase [Candidatus Wallbacteria bacterium HGW-Wallbacteria-1]